MTQRKNHLALKRKRIATAVATIIATTLGIFYFAADPSTFRWMPKCAVYHLTGYQCPGCGSQRALHALLHGHVAEAWNFNALFVAAIPLMVFMGITELLHDRCPGLYRHVYSPFATLAIAFVITGWTIFRNL